MIDKHAKKKSVNKFVYFEHNLLPTEVKICFCFLFKKIKTTSRNKGEKMSVFFEFWLHQLREYIVQIFLQFKDSTRNIRFEFTRRKDFLKTKIKNGKKLKFFILLKYHQRMLKYNVLL